MIKTYRFFCIILMALPFTTLASEPPKVIVGIVVDMMMYDYLEQFGDKFNENGIRKLMNEGYSFTNARINYVPTYTGPGHATIATGYYPSVHGIVGNRWYDRVSDRTIYCAQSFAETNEVTGKNFINHSKSAEQRLKPSIGDRISGKTHGKGKVISISIKDRSALLSGSWSSENSYWFESSNAKWLTSAVPGKRTPGWLSEFNSSGITDSLFLLEWSLLLPEGSYNSDLEDNNQYEGIAHGEDDSSFPHISSPLENDKYREFKYTPFSNSLTTIFALTAMRYENIGSDQHTDFVSISYSATDYIGHRYGIESIEVEDAMLRLDLEIGKVIEYLDKEVGKGDYLLYLTSDHGACPNPAYEKNRGKDAGYIPTGSIRAHINKVLEEKYNDTKLVRGIINQQVYLDHEAINDKGVSTDSITGSIVSGISKIEGIKAVYTSKEITQGRVKNEQTELIKNGFYPERCGDIIYILKEGWLERDTPGTTHGSGYDYDTHVPLLFYGYGITTGNSDLPAGLADIAPTIMKLTGIPVPDDFSGSPLDLE